MKLQRETKIFIKVVVVLLGKMFSCVTFQYNILGLCVWPTAPDTGEAGVVVGVSETPLYNRIVRESKFTPLLVPQTEIMWRYSWFNVSSMATSTNTDIAGYKCNVE